MCRLSQPNGASTVPKPGSCSSCPHGTVVPPQSDAHQPLHAVPVLGYHGKTTAHFPIQAGIVCTRSCWAGKSLRIPLFGRGKREAELQQRARGQAAKQDTGRTEPELAVCLLMCLTTRRHAPASVASTARGGQPTSPTKIRGWGK